MSTLKQCMIYLKIHLSFLLTNCYGIYIKAFDFTLDRSYNYQRRSLFYVLHCLLMIYVCRISTDCKTCRATFKGWEIWKKKLLKLNEKTMKTTMATYWIQVHYPKMCINNLAVYSLYDIYLYSFKEFDRVLYYFGFFFLSAQSWCCT